MTNEEVIELLQSVLSLQEIKVKSEGSHYQIIAVDERFAQMTRVKRQQLVYAPLSEKISDGTVHAVSIKTFTPDQWQREKLFNQ